MPTGRLQGKRVLITGIGGGMGRAAALRFGQEGAVVIGSDIDEETIAETVRLGREQGIDIDSFAPVDLADYEQVERWITDAIGWHADKALAPSGRTRISTARWSSRTRPNLR